MNKNLQFFANSNTNWFLHYLSGKVKRKEFEKNDVGALTCSNDFLNLFCNYFLYFALQEVHKRQVQCILSQNLENHPWVLKLASTLLCVQWISAHTKCVIMCVDTVIGTFLHIDIWYVREKEIDCLPKTKHNGRTQSSSNSNQ